jgi:hypothetical protein
MSEARPEPTIRFMKLELQTVASTSWPDAAVAIAGVALVASVAVVVIWQALATWRTRIAVVREQQYRELAERTARDLDHIRRQLSIADDPSEEEQPGPIRGG